MRRANILKAVMVAASSLTLFVTANQVNAAATNRQKQAGVISVNYSGLGKVALLDSNGHYTGQYVNKNSRWKIFEKADINGRTMYRLGTDKQWIPAQYASQNTATSAISNRQIKSGTITVTYSGLGRVALIDASGNYTSQYVNKGSHWKVVEQATINGRTMYRLGTDRQWIPAQYASFYTPSVHNTYRASSSNSGMSLSGMPGQGPDVTKPLWDKPIEVPDGTKISGLTADIAHVVTPTYIIGPTGKRYDLPVGNADGIAQTIAKAINESGLHLTDKQRVGLAAEYVALFTGFSNYTMSGPYYAKPYGLFVKHEYSCAGTARALGLVLGYMGYHWQHVNPNAYKHQWVQVQMDGKTGWADGEIGYVGYGNNWGDDVTWYH